MHRSARTPRTDADPIPSSGADGAPATSTHTSNEVLFVGPMGRSGSTLFERMLGSTDRLVSLGELVHLWERGLGQNNLCGCGERFLSCPYWSEVGREAFGGWDRLSAQGIVTLKRRVDRNRYLPWLIAPDRAPASFRRDLANLVDDVLDPLYSAIGRLAGPDQVLVDASKNPSYAYVLRHVPSVRLRAVHLVREPEGVVHSWKKKVVKPEVVDREEHMHQYSAVDTAARWTAFNLCFEPLGRLGVPVSFVRYSDVVADPRGTLMRMSQVLDTPLTEADLTLIHQDRVELRANHTVAGNPMRFATGEIEIRADDGWKGKLSTPERIAVSAITGPLEAWYRRR